jgi:hypothetical protein
MGVQTERPKMEVGFTQTTLVDKSEEACQTVTHVVTQSVQVGKQSEMVDSNTEPDQDILDEINKQIEDKIKKSLTKSKPKMKNLAIDIPASKDDGEIKIARPPMSARNLLTQASFRGEISSRDQPDDRLSVFSFSEQSRIDYMLNRDPLEEFFKLTCQAIKLNSPHMNMICTIDTKSLYKKALKLNIPFFKWHIWIEDFLNKEFFRLALENSRRKSIARPQNSKTFTKIEKATEQNIIEQANYFQ